MRLRGVEPSTNHLPREPHLDMIGQLTPPLYFVSILVLNITDDVALFLWHLKHSAHPVCRTPRCQICWRAARPCPKIVDVGVIRCVEAATVEGVKVEPDGVCNCNERLKMGEVVNLYSDLRPAGVLEPLLGRKHREKAYVWI